MATHKPEQLRITLHGRELHFVAYEGIPANVRRGEPAVPPTWYLMSGGKRHRVMEYLIGQPVAERDNALRQWAEENALGPASDREVRAQLRKQTADVQREDWWSAR
jgi:hypothetical protein